MPLLSIDDRSDPVADDEVVESASWDQVESAIRSLDGKRRTMVTVEQDEIRNLAVGGGDGRYLVTITEPDDEFRTLYEPGKGEDPVPLVTGGQLGEHPGRTVVDLDTALTAARTYFDTGALDPSLSWLDE